MRRFTIIHSVIPAQAGIQVLLILCLLLLPIGCGDTGTEPVVDLNGATVVYSGDPTEDMLEIAEKVKRCMGETREALPKVTLVDKNFKCRTSSGWVDAWGCYDYQGHVTLSLPRYLDACGQPWAHELTHFYGDHGEHNECGNYGWGNITVITFDGQDTNEIAD